MSRLKREDGFTYLEMLVAIAMSVIVFGAVLSVLDAYSHQWVAGTKRTDAQDFARLGVDRIVRQLRNIASPVTTPKLLERATAYDVVFQTVGAVNGANLSGAERVRYCVPPDPSGTASAEVLWGEVQTWSTTTPAGNPWSSDPTATLPCPDSPLPTGVSASIIAPSVVNRYKGADHPVFSFGSLGSAPAPSQLGQVFTVQIDLLVNPTPTFTNAQSELQSAAFLRNQPRAPVANFTYTATGGGGVLLNGGTSYSPDGEDLSYSWSCTSPSPCPDAAGLTSADTALVDWHPGAGTYTVTLTVTDQTGLSTTSAPPQTVTVT